MGAAPGSGLFASDRPVDNKIVCIPVNNICSPNVTNTIAAPATATGAGTVTYLYTIANNGPAVIYPDVLQVADTVLNNASSFTVNYSFAVGTACAPNKCTLAPTISGTLPPFNESSPQTVAAKFSATPLPVGQSITFTYTANFTYLACIAGEIQNTASLGYSDGTGTISDTNNANNTSNDPPTALPAYVTLPPDVTTCPPVLNVVKTVSPTSSLGSGSLPWSTLWTYTITLKSTGPLPATTLTDFVFKTVPTPVFTPAFTGSVKCSPASACGPPTLSTPTVSTNNDYTIFTVPINAITSSTGGTVTIMYSVHYNPECETNTGQDSITNEADWNVSSIDYRGFANAFLAENTACQLSTCKVNFDDTANPNPAVDCAKPATPTVLNFSGTQTFTAFYQNLASTPTPVGTILDALSVSSQTYGAFPINYTYSCNFLSPFTNTLGTPYQNAGFPAPLTALVKWNDPQWAGLTAINLQNKILPPNSTLMCKVTVSTLGSAPPNLPALCQGTGVPELTNSALMDLSAGVNYNNSGDTPQGL